MDTGWPTHVDYRWQSKAVVYLLDGFPGLELEEVENQNPLKVSYYLDPSIIEMEAMKKALGRMSTNVNILIQRGASLNLLPKRASKGRALRSLANQ